MQVGSIVADFTYFFKHTFSSKQLYVSYIVILGIRCLVPLIAVIKNTCVKVCNKENNRLRALDYLEPHNEDGISAKQKQSEHTRQGCLLYSTLPLMYFTGSYRLLNFKNFPSEIGTGLVLDFFCYTLPLLFIQVINNTTLYQQQYELTGFLHELNNLQTFGVASKMLLMADLALEFVMFVYEMIKLHQLEKQGVNVIIRYSEQERRLKFAKKYACRTMFWLVFIFASFLLAQFFIDPVTCLDDQAVEWSSVCQNCMLDNCATCRNTGKDKCDKCSFGYFFDEA